jgi:hypothetical protein
VVDDAPPATAPTARAPRATHDWLDEDDTVAAKRRPRPPRPDGEPVHGDLAVDDPAEYRPPPRR